MVFQCINIRQIPREVLKTAASGLSFQHLPRDLGMLMHEQELRQAGHYTPMASKKMQHIKWLLYNSVLQI